MPVLKVRRVGNSLGIVLPSDLVKAKGLRADDAVRVEVEPVLSLEEVAGRLRKYRRTVAEWNEATNEGEEL
jgi:antitoxin component of MazEF toxin-antitoxin module